VFEGLVEPYRLIFLEQPGESWCINQCQTVTGVKQLHKTNIDLERDRLRTTRSRFILSINFIGLAGVKCLQQNQY